MDVTIQGYFERPKTPAAGSPVGALMLRVLAKNLGMGFEDARAQANSLLQRAAGKKVYRQPIVLSPEEQAGEKDRLRKAFGAKDRTPAQTSLALA